MDGPPAIRVGAGLQVAPLRDVLHGVVAGVFFPKLAEIVMDFVEQFGKADGWGNAKLGEVSQKPKIEKGHDVWLRGFLALGAAPTRRALRVGIRTGLPCRGDCSPYLDTSEAEYEEHLTTHWRKR